MAAERTGSLTGLRVLEFAAIGPVPYAAMLLADFGADVVRVDRPDAKLSHPFGAFDRGRRSIALDLKSPGDMETALRLMDRADMVVEGFRPGVMERLGLGPEVALARNPRLVYGRMTGWGQSGPLADKAGHDINYLALTGALAAIGPKDGKPVPPLNLVADFGGGSMFLIFGLLAAHIEAQRSGKGQVVDAAMVDGASSLMSLFHWMGRAGAWTPRRGENLLDGGAPFYTTYECADGRHVALGALEPEFWAEFRRLAGLSDPLFDRYMDRSNWAEIGQRLTDLFRTRTRDEWAALMQGSDACLTPVLTLEEAASHPHMQARGTLDEAAGMTQPAPAPRLSRTPGGIASGPAKPGAHTDEVLKDWGVKPA
ncbi:CaiB/BaiF CoA transferase family protein [Indioceanicola profundi]|uniref:CaiB/BaiF CoA transferase family protein n=1 Tax=Indioceanicola profundi TaxID=2220096 RepID=UPI000E6AC94E|nr:CaiB/BaiF CoA-transferase family protein [Indioceanicola profundi]